MSFYDDASLVFLPSGGAGKDGKAYSIKPVEELGSELVTNGGFDTDSDWTKGTGWTISGGAANCDGTQTTNSLLYQNLGDLSNKTIKFTFTISGYSAGQLSTAFFGAAGTQVENVSANGTYTFNIDVQSGHNGNTGFTANSSFIGSVDNVSVKEVIVDGDFTFSRGINLTATRVDSNGLIEKGRENLLENSVWDGVTTDTKPTGWTFQLVSGTGTFDVTATEGQIRFQTLDASSRAFIYSPTITTNGIVVASVYVDEVTTAMPLSDLLSRSANATDLFAYEDGVEINYSDNVQAGKRYSVVFNKTASTNFRFGVGVSSATLGDIVLSRPQIEVGLVATEYIESGATKGKAGLLEQEPRFDYSGGASCSSLLLEPQRTNNIPQSEYLGDSIVWAQLETIVTQNEEVSPEGLQNASKLLCVSGFANHQIDAMNVSISSGAVTGSVYAKKGANADWLRLRLSGTSNPPRAWFDLQNGVVGSVDVSGTASIEDVGNGWYRCSLTEAGNTASGGGGRLQIFINKSDGQTQFTSNGDEYHYVYGAQMEAGSYATSYIPNHSGSGSVTRGADLCNGAGDASTFNDSEGVLYAEIAALTDDQSSRTITLTDGTFDERIQLSYYTGGSNQIRVFIKSGGTFSAVITTTLTDITEFNKIAYRYKSGETKLFINGSLIGTSADTFSITGLNVLQFANGDGLSNPLQGKAKQVIVFNTALSNTDLEILTGTSYESFAAMATALNYTTYE